MRRGRRIQPAKGQGGPLDPHLKLHHQLEHPAGQGLVLALSPEPCLLSLLTGTAIFLKITVSVYGIIKSGCGVIMDAYGVVKYGCALMATVMDGYASNALNAWVGALPTGSLNMPAL